MEVGDVPLLRRQNKISKAGEQVLRQRGDQDSPWGMAGMEKAVGTDPLLRSGEVVGGQEGVPPQSHWDHRWSPGPGPG